MILKVIELLLPESIVGKPMSPQRKLSHIYEERPPRKVTCPKCNKSFITRSRISQCFTCGEDVSYFSDKEEKLLRFYGIEE